MTDRRKVLVVDDDPFVRDLLIMVLTSVGTFDADAAADGAEALQRCLSGSIYDLIISDMEMPVMSGLSLIDELRKKAVDTPIIILTGNNQISMAVGAMKSGANDYLMKDENIQETILLSAEKVLEKYELTRQNQRLLADLENKNKELQSMVAELAEARDLATTANEIKSRFLASMSHELRTPLNAIIGYSEMIQEEAEDRGMAEMTKDVGKVTAAARHLLALINDVLDLSKIEAGKMTFFFETFPVADMVGDVVSMVRLLAEKNANTLQVSCPEVIGSMHGDVTRVRQVLFNLLSNSCKFTDHGIIRLDVFRENEVCSCMADQRLPAEEWLRFVVADSGIGMSPEQLGKLFQDFSQAEGASTTKKFGGTGLGLAISKKLCKMMLGNICVSSQPGKGTTFTMHLPASPVRDP